MSPPVNHSGWFLGSLLAATMAGCGGDGGGDPSLTSTTPQLPQGSYQVAAVGDTVGTGEAFFDKGNGYVFLSSDGDAAATVVYVTSSVGARRVPATTSRITLSFARQTPTALTPLTATGMAGSYVAWVAGQSVSIIIAPDGSIAAGLSTCKLAGSVNYQLTYGDALSATVDVSNCKNVNDGRYTGLLYAAPNLQPAAFRLVAENRQQVIDLLAFR